MSSERSKKSSGNGKPSSSSISKKPSSEKSDPSSQSFHLQMPVNNSRTFEDGLPRSVRDVPDDMRVVIRRRQNTENARRMRERRRDEMHYMENKYEENNRRIDALEKTVNDLSNELMGSGSKPGSSSDSRRTGISNGKKDRSAYGAPF